MRIQWATQSYKDDSLSVSSQRNMNFYAEKEPPDAKTEIANIPAPGIVPFVTAGTGAIRGFTVMNNVLYAVSGGSLYSVTVAGTVNLLGSGIGGFSVVSMTNNGFQVQIVNGVSGWIYAPSESFFANAATVGAGGADYALGDTSTIAGGVYTSPAVLLVTGVGGGGAITSVSVQAPGQYSTEAISPASQSATSGIGSGATFNVTFSGPPVGFAQITDANFFPAATTTYYDEYFVLPQSGTNKWFFSQILDGTTYNALDFESAEVNPGFVIAIVNQQENLLIFCQKAIETWYDTGANDNPFARYDGATIERGCAAPYAVVKEDNSVFFMGEDLVFYRLDGVLLHRISTHAIEQAWSAYPTVSDCFVFSYTFAGHKFIVVTFPSGNATFVFDISTNLWHERVSYVAATPTTGRWRGNCAIIFNNQVLIGDALSGQIGYLSPTTYTEFGQPIIGLMDSPPTHKDRKRIFIPILELNMRTGTGLTTGQGSDPQVMLQISKNQGETYGHFERWQSMGKQGAYLTRLRWKKLGASRDWRFRVMISDPVPRTVMAAYATAELEEV